MSIPANVYARVEDIIPASCMTPMRVQFYEQDNMVIVLNSSAQTPSHKGLNIEKRLLVGTVGARLGR